MCVRWKVGSRHIGAIKHIWSTIAPLSAVAGDRPLGLYILSGQSSHHKILWSLEATRFGFRLFQSLFNLTGKSVSGSATIRSLWHPISRLGVFIFVGTTSYCLMNRGPYAFRGIQLVWTQKTSGLKQQTCDVDGIAGRQVPTLGVLTHQLRLWTLKRGVAALK